MTPQARCSFNDKSGDPNKAAHHTDTVAKAQLKRRPLVGLIYQYPQDIV
ncbi:hypothetical protein [Pelagibaculum spongiae]|nr:hypothetical protein [Pelagibaculum spongiae]